VCPSERTLLLAASRHVTLSFMYRAAKAGVGDKALPPQPNTHGQPELPWVA
jgi:hypothetical protein